MANHIYLTKPTALNMDITGSLFLTSFCVWDFIFTHIKAHTFLCELLSLLKFRKARKFAHTLVYFKGEVQSKK